MAEATRVLSIAEAARLARMSFDRQRVFLGTTPEGCPVWSFLGSVITQPGGLRKPIQKARKA